jgi:hypothetical protein
MTRITALFSLAPWTIIGASMYPPAIQAALDNLVETVRTSVTAEFLEFFRGEAKPRVKAGRKARQVPTPKAGGRRTSESVEQVGKLIVSHLRKNPDSRVEQIAEALGGHSTKELALPIKKLLADKAIAKKGQRRGTTYRAR